MLRKRYAAALDLSGIAAACFNSLGYSIVALRDADHDGPGMGIRHLLGNRPRFFGSILPVFRIGRYAWVHCAPYFLHCSVIFR